MNTDELERIKALLREMFKADREYGCGFYNDERWLAAYRELQRAMGMEDE
jgi:hypothetical protein